MPMACPFVLILGILAPMLAFIVSRFPFGKLFWAELIKNSIPKWPGWAMFGISCLVSSVFFVRERLGSFLG